MTARRIAVAILAAGLAGLAAADDKKPAEPKAPDWSGYVKATVVRGEVTRADDKGFSLKVVAGRNGNQPKYDELLFAYADASLVRWKKLPPKMEAGKRKPYTPEELAELKSPRGAPGYAAGREDLKQGYLLEVTLVRPKEIPASKAAFQDLRVQYAVILTEDKDAAPRLGKKDDDKVDDGKKTDDKEKGDKDAKKKEEKKEEKKDGPPPTSSR
jgi:hypothetical protein